MNPQHGIIEYCSAHATTQELIDAIKQVLRDDGKNDRLFDGSTRALEQALAHAEGQPDDAN